MYGSSQATIGYGLRKLGYPNEVFSADKVWISCRQWAGSDRAVARCVGRAAVRSPPGAQSGFLGTALDTLLGMKADGRLRYVGITTSEGRRHAEIERIMADQPIDFVQVTYNIVDREVEARILPLARERGIAVIANRPFREGALLRQLEQQPLPAGLPRPARPAGRSSSCSSSSPILRSPAPSRQRPGSIMCARTWRRRSARCQMRPPASAWRTM